ncbi:ATP-dependent Clp protease protease subunit [Actinoallomurus bryophytorum]|uniref:ATP-dependent Clp protease proteolytic subunit n=1 Tax=Actinoallomurus bryophytorum TaxID=1490222 RepID=A0A543CVZ9_9ACTN|nr:ATP-dependent Clp protease proteolytic subunit [Actinoallomurus bryophytorum]TQM01282.1 ATP-dependent Clp protease protease subunit [Actinoallomurus bryophytorum]
MTMPSFPPEFPHEPSRGDPRDEPPRGMPATPSAADLLFDRRIVVANGRIEGDLAIDLSARLIMLDGTGDGPIALHLRAPDADLEAAFAVADTMGVLSCPVDVLVIGQAGGPALAILTAARHREMTPHATLLLTEPRTRAEGPASDVAIHEEEHRRKVDAFYVRLAEITGREADEIREDARQGRMLTAEQARDYGLIHDIAGTPPPRT